LRPAASHNAAVCADATCTVEHTPRLMMTPVEALTLGSLPRLRVSSESMSLKQGSKK
jgi:hypothetical protein